jgi:hypothetical protein
VRPRKAAKRGKHFARNKGRAKCPTGKVRYRDKTEALHGMSAIVQGSGRDRLPTRTYECPMCAGWHLTSQADAFA